ncbi:DNA-binding response regulator [Flavipsychrobacter stenotrophus]|uniref:DNA-binding response regulator n=1 Tax=Flavipsychrobacter stenotrophus TaxID=2077091 RepID=A0A2S7SVZ7_9BACT|nr:response regulator transcription factor [Flavipsychrobacter stenotrophus]PQJ10765.1 DNA-binding response regulator [Flavipsychrobacter stenotrophus]
MKKTGIVLVDDHHILLDGLSALLKKQKDMEVMGAYTRGSDLLIALNTLQPDVALVDINMPDMNGIALTTQLKELHPEIKVICLSMHDGVEYILEMANAGVWGYLLKNTNDQELLEAIRTVHSGQLYFPEEIADKMSTEALRREQKANEIQEIKLTERELEILKLIAQEYSNARIASTLFISERTVETHRKNMLRKTRNSTMLGLLKFAMERGLV